MPSGPDDLVAVTDRICSSHQPIRYNQQASVRFFLRWYRLQVPTTEISIQLPAHLPVSGGAGEIALRCLVMVED
jgi:hypothetical protein